MARIPECLEAEELNRETSYSKYRCGTGTDFSVVASDTTLRVLDNFTLSGRNHALRDETASPPVYASLSSSVRYLGESAFTFSMNAA